MRRPDYDVVVMGVGGMGSATLYHLARRGVSVCGIEQYEIAHDRGSSHGDTRIIRKAYFESPEYVPLLHRGYELWAELEAASGCALFEQCGFITCGQPESEAIRCLEACYGAHDVAHERLSEEETRERYPQLRLQEGSVSFLDPFGGFLRVEDCVRCHADQARHEGADLFVGETVLSWDAGDDGVVVRTSERELRAETLVITAGAWAARELNDLGVKTDVWRKVVFWYDSPNIDDFGMDRFPTFYVDTDYGQFYGFPAFDETGLKVAEHADFTLVDDPAMLECDLLPGDEPPISAFLADVFPSMEPERIKHAVCMYTVTPDHHFVIDLHPEHSNVVIGAGFSGHGFKFASVVGEVLADFATERRTEQPIGFLGFDRFAS